jgi:hypothetical protein
MTFTFKLERLDGTPADPPSFKKDRAWQNGELDEAERTSRGPSSEKAHQRYLAERERQEALRGQDTQDAVRGVAQGSAGAQQVMYGQN